jgi:hypothetical protein
MEQDIAQGIKLVPDAIMGRTDVRFVAAVLVLWGFEVGHQFPLGYERLGTESAWVTSILIDGDFEPGRREDEVLPH